MVRIIEISELNQLHKEGKIHKMLLYRIISLCIVILVFIGTIISGFVKNGISFLQGLYFIPIGIVLGFFIFSKIHKIEWDRKKRIIKVHRFDSIGITLLVIHIALQWYIGDAFGYIYHEDTMIVSSVTISLLLGLVLGRFLKILKTINKIHGDLRKAKLLK